MSPGESRGDATIWCPAGQGSTTTSLYHDVRTSKQAPPPFTRPHSALGCASVSLSVNGSLQGGRLPLFPFQPGNLGLLGSACPGKRLQLQRGDLPSMLAEVMALPTRPSIMS